MDAIGVYRAQIREFFERAKGEKRYKSELLSMPPPKRLIIYLSDIRKFSKELADLLRERASFLLPAIEEIASEIAQVSVKIGLSGVVGGGRIGPRGLNSSMLGKLVCVEGIVTSASIVRPKIKQSVHYNAKGNLFVYKEYRDLKNLSLLPPTSIALPKYSLEGNKLDLEYGLSEYIAHQSGVLQEMPELAPPGQMPRGVSLVLEDDLAGLIKPGDRVRVYGVFKCISYVRSASDLLRTALIANNIELVGKEGGKETVTTAVLDLARKEGLTGLARNVAPSIYGHEAVKKALLLMLVGGSAVHTESGGYIRGDINVLMVGDPGIAKSQMLRYVLDIAPLAVGTTGRGASGVGLTAAVVSNPDTGLRQVEAGAMVLADTGIVCIDEFDKMDESERAAIHEAMEQQSVTIAKGGVHTTLNARCSVLAAANPVSGQYRVGLSPKDNIRMPESLLTRFDLIFLMEDSTEYDAEIAEHVLKRRMGRSASVQMISQMEMKAYIQYAKELQPVLSEEASAKISSEYVRMRVEGEKNRTNLARGVTARLLESIIRLATAFAKIRLAEEVEVIDVDSAVDLLEPTLWRKSIRPKASANTAEPEDLAEILFAYRKANPHDMIVSLEKVVSLCGGDREEVLRSLNELEKENVLFVNEGMVAFR
ncbi:DNA replication licensing factor MCM3 [Nematocida homosporus]|uniref:DNA replication licensing factor MCM3 n=1 Tax=Nematocida homosporus TaxID=1912981 RepID=UPI00221EE857|nr:DNA replication licensing factor MCM3 [Nematocida homosporus]KAI5186359.1 DNA replication licensing factor MCM3 [Nematocida homosporus]